MDTSQVQVHVHRDSGWVVDGNRKAVVYRYDPHLGMVRSWVERVEERSSVGKVAFDLGGRLVGRVASRLVERTGLRSSQHITRVLGHGTLTLTVLHLESSIDAANLMVESTKPTSNPTMERVTHVHGRQKVQRNTRASYRGKPNLIS